MADNFSEERKRLSDLRSSRLRSKLNLLKSFVSIHCWAHAQFLNNFLKVTVERPGFPVALRAQHHSLAYCPGLFWCMIGVHGWVLSSQLRLLKSEIFSVLDLRNSKSCRTRNLDINFRPRLPPKNWLVIRVIYYSTRKHLEALGSTWKH